MLENRERIDRSRFGIHRKYPLTVNDAKTNKQTNKQTHRQTDIRTDILRNRRTDKQTDTQLNRYTNRPTYGMTNEERETKKHVWL